jgi:hypothetical protein
LFFSFKVKTNLFGNTQEADFGDKQFSTLDRAVFSLKPSPKSRNFIFNILPSVLAPEKLKLELAPISRL